MANEVYIANQAGNKLKTLSKDQQLKIVKVIDSLGGEGWKSGKLVRDNHTFRIAGDGDATVLFRYVPEQHSIIVVDVDPHIELPMAVAV